MKIKKALIAAGVVVAAFHVGKIAGKSEALSEFIVRYGKHIPSDELKIGLIKKFVVLIQKND